MIVFDRQYSMFGIARRLLLIKHVNEGEGFRVITYKLWLGRKGNLKLAIPLIRLLRWKDGACL